jgi:hypothetical protein
MGKRNLFARIVYYFLVDNSRKKKKGEHNMEKIENVQKLGIAIGRTVGSIYEARQEGMKTIDRNLSLALQRLIEVAKQEIRNEVDQIEALCMGLAEGIIRSRAPLVKVYAALKPLPGEPQFEIAWGCTDEDFREHKIFKDKREQIAIKACNTAAQLIIKFAVEQIRQIVKERDQRNGLR